LGRQRSRLERDLGLEEQPAGRPLLVELTLGLERELLGEPDRPAEGCEGQEDESAEEAHACLSPGSEAKRYETVRRQRAEVLEQHVAGAAPRKLVQCPVDARDVAAVDENRRAQHLELASAFLDRDLLRDTPDSGEHG